MRTPPRVMLQLTVLALAALAIPASAAQASTSASTGASCDDGSGFALPAGAPLPDMARGGEGPREPQLNEQYEELPADAVGRGRNWGTAVTVPVWFHVVHDNGVGNVSDADIDRQIRILNAGFSGAYGGYDQGFRFTLAGTTRTDNAEWFNAGPGSSAERAMKKALQQGDMGTLNYYSTTAGVYLGWAYFPGLNDSRAFLDGIVVDWESMYKTSDTYKNRYDLGLTAVHEAGHWFALAHTFDGGCNAHGDFVADTPAMKVPTSGCPPDATKDTCPNDAGFDPIHNYMDYSYDQCYTEFTQGQADRAHDYWLEFRA